MRPRAMICAVAGVLATAPNLPLAAQACLGLPGESGSVTWGFNGTDGATGEAWDLAIVSGPMSVGLSRSSLDKFAQDDDISTVRVRVASVVADRGAQICFVASPERTSYASGNTATSWTESGIRYEQYRVDGRYQRVRVPLGLAVGHEFGRGARVGINPFLGVGVALDYESMHRFSGVRESRNTTGVGANVGFTTRIGHALLRSELQTFWTADRALSGHNNFGLISLQLGWIF